MTRVQEEKLKMGYPAATKSCEAARALKAAFEIKHPDKRVVVVEGCMVKTGKMYYGVERLK